MKKEFNKGWFNEFYYIICAYKAGCLTRYELIAKWDREQMRLKEVARV